MWDTKGWILYVMLATSGGSIEIGPKPDCVAAAREWMKEARAWEARSNLEPGSMWVCVPPRTQVRLVSR